MNNENNNNQYNEEYFEEETIVVEEIYIEAESLPALQKAVNKKIDDGYTPIEANPFFNPQNNKWCKTLVYEMTEEEIEEEEKVKSKK